MSNQRYKGDQHVKEVADACNLWLQNKSISQFPETTRKTVEYIFLNFPSLSSVRSKFQFDNPDKYPDLILIDNNGTRHLVNLFLIKERGAVQPKNLGAKSFLKKYFLSPNLQKRFNSYFEEEYELFLKLIMGLDEEEKIDSRLLRRAVKAKYPRFLEEIEPFRKSFLFNLREYSFYLLREEYNADTHRTKHAFDYLLMKGTKNIITRYTVGNKCLLVEEYFSKADPDEELKIYKKGQNSIGIRAGEEALLLRFKFESGPTSSIKLATGFETFTYDKEIKSQNSRLVKCFEEIINSHSELITSNKSNAIGKVNEAAVYYEFVKQHPQIYQIDSEEGIKIFEKYSRLINKVELKEILNAAKGTVKKITTHLLKKFNDYDLDSVQLVPDSYIKNRLDTSDLKVVIKKGTDYKEETLSLKAMALKKKETLKFTSKNAGAGTILGENYFDVADLSKFLKEIKQKFLERLYTHRQCLEKVSEKIGLELEDAPQEKLKEGLKALLGHSTLIITYYKDNECLVFEHEEINSHIIVKKQSPSLIQTTLLWGGEEAMFLRVKFSSSQAKGWSSLKLACDYQINIV